MLTNSLMGGVVVNRWYLQCLAAADAAIGSHWDISVWRYVVDSWRWFVIFASVVQGVDVVVPCCSLTPVGGWSPLFKWGPTGEESGYPRATLCAVLVGRGWVGGGSFSLELRMLTLVNVEYWQWCSALLWDLLSSQRYLRTEVGEHNNDQVSHYGR